MMPTRNNYTGFPKMGEAADRLTAFRAALRPMIAKMADHDPAQYRNHAEEIEAVRREAE